MATRSHGHSASEIPSRISSLAPDTPTSSSSGSQKNSPERERGLVNRPSDASLSSLSATQGRSFRRVFSRTSFAGPADGVSWSAILEEAQQMIERDEFLAIVVRQKVLRHASFAEALVDSLSSVFHSATIPAAEWAKLFSLVYQDDLVYEVSHRQTQAPRVYLLSIVRPLSRPHSLPHVLPLSSGPRHARCGENGAARPR